MKALIHPELGNIRCKIVKGEPFFVAKDVCEVLGIKNSRKALYSISDDDKGVTTSNTLGGKQEMATVNESGLYQLIFQSRKPTAKKFTKWVTGEVLPMIRKYGFYSTDSRKVAKADEKLEHESFLALSREIRKHLTVCDEEIVARQCKTGTFRVWQVLHGKVKDVHMMGLLYARAKGNQSFYPLFYSKQGAEKLLSEFQGESSVIDLQ